MSINPTMPDQEAPVSLGQAVERQYLALLRGDVTELVEVYRGYLPLLEEQRVWAAKAAAEAEAELKRRQAFCTVLREVEDRLNLETVS